MRFLCVLLTALTFPRDVLGWHPPTQARINYGSDGAWGLKVNFDRITLISRTTTTLQVVSNPILDREFVAPNGTRFPNPIHDQAFASLRALNADLVRYVPWFPYPQVSVAELDAPTANNTSWAFAHILPMLTDFMDATYGNGHTTVINFSTQPCWLFGDSEGQPQNCSYPANPNESFFGYVRGDRKNLLDPSAKSLADYYVRLLQFLVLGEFTDESGQKHTGGPRYDLSNGHVWELFNEAEHGYSVDQYIHDYDVIVPRMRAAVGSKSPQFMGIGGANADWVAPFLNGSLHTKPAPPMDYISLHHYSKCSQREDPATYHSFFTGAKQFCDSLDPVLEQIRTSSFPHTKLDLDELGVIMPDDNNPNLPLNASLPDIYWNAAGAMYAYMFVQLAPQGVEVLGHSQLAGSPKIPEWGIPLPQYPSVSLLDWRTGLGNARYWVLKLLIEHFGPGDKLVATVLSPPSPAAPVCSGGVGVDPVCGIVSGPDYTPVLLGCCDETQVIASVDFADWGLPSGQCGDFHSDPACTANATGVREWVEKKCLGNRNCSLAPWPELGDPCPSTVKRFAVQGHCSGAKGGFTKQDGAEIPEVVGLAAIDQQDGHKKILLVNTHNATQLVDVKGLGPSDWVLHIVDPHSVQRASKTGIRKGSVPVGMVLSLEPYSVTVLVDTSA